MIGTDFLRMVEVNMKCGEIFVKPMHEMSPNDEINFPEILNIDVICEREENRADVSHVENVIHKQILTDLVNNYEPQKSREMDIIMKLVLKDDELIYQSPRRLSQTEKEVVNKQIEQWITEGIVQPSLSEYASPIVLVRKRDGSFRLCVDYRLINNVIR